MLLNPLLPSQCLVRCLIDGTVTVALGPECGSSGRSLAEHVKIVPHFRSPVVGRDSSGHQSIKYVRR